MNTTLQRRLVMSIGLVVAMHSVAAGQTANIAGTVVDASGAVLPGATVSATQRSTGLVQTTVGQGTGRYVLAGLPIGTYTVTASLSGFQEAIVRDVVLTLNETSRVDFQLALEGRELHVEVRGEAALLSTATGELGQVIDARLVEHLPVNGRDFIKLGMLVPGAQPNVEGSMSGSIVINGQRPTSNQYRVDGVDVTAGGGLFGFRAPGSGAPQGAAGTGSSLVTVDAIEEFKIQTANYSAAYGQMSGGVVNIVTRAGSNDWEGSVYDYFRDSRLDANDFFLNSGGIEKPPFTFNNAGGTLGGPLLRNRTFVFATYDHFQEVFSRAVNGTTLARAARERADPAVRPLLEFFPGGTRPDDADGLSAPYTAAAESRGREDDFALRLDQLFGASDRLSARYSFSDSDSRVGGQFGTFPLSFQTSEIRLQTFGLSHTHVLTPTLLSSSTAGLTRNSTRIFAVLEPGPDTAGNPFGSDRQPKLPQVAILPITLRGGSSPPQLFNINDVTVRNQLTWVRGEHMLRTGIDYRHIEDHLLNVANGAGLFLFLTVDQFLQNQPFFFVNFTGDVDMTVRFNNLAGYIQDEWRIGPKLTLDLGLRYELNTVPSEADDRFRNIDQIDNLATATLTSNQPLYRGDYDNWAPRAGFAYALGKGTVLRGGVGLYYDTPTQLAGGLFFNPGVSAINVIFGPPLGGTARVPIDPSLLRAKPSLDPPFGQSTVIDPALRTANVLHYTLNVDRQLAPGLAVRAGYVGSRSDELYRQRALNLLDPGSGKAPNSNFPAGGITLIDNSASARYDALQVGFDARLNRLRATAAYTWARAIDDVSTTGGVASVNSNIFPMDPHNPGRDRGNSDFDIRHNLSISYSYDLPLDRVDALPAALRSGWAVHGITSFHTGFPYTPILGTATVNNGDPNQGGTNRPDLVAGADLYTSRPGNPDRIANAGAFACPGGGSIAAGCAVVGRFGTAGRNILRAPDFLQFDFALSKATALPGGLSLDIRTEIFNLFNRANLANPGATGTNVLSSPQFGQPLAMANFSTTGIGQFFNAGGPRSVQLAARLRF